MESVHVSVYVDSSIYAYGRMIMCHMIADTPEELHAMADRIGIARRWYQAPPKASMPHYDIAKGKRALAVAFGAISCDRNAFVAAMRRIRASGAYGVTAVSAPACRPAGDGEVQEPGAEGGEEASTEAAVRHR